MIWCGQSNHLQIAKLNQHVYCLSICVGKVAIDPSCYLFCTNSNQYKILLKKKKKKSTVHVIRLFNWSWYVFALTPCSAEFFIFGIKSLTLIIPEVALLIYIAIFCKIMSRRLNWELSILSPFRISSLHLGKKILSQFSGIGDFESISLNLSLENFCCQRLFTILTDMEIN